MQHDDSPPLHLTRLHQRWPCSFLPLLPSTFASSPSMFDDLAFPPCFSIFFIIFFLSIIFTTNASICQPTSPPLYIRLFSNYTIDMTNNTKKKNLTQHHHRLHLHPHLKPIQVPSRLTAYIQPLSSRALADLKSPASVAVATFSIPSYYSIPPFAAQSPAPLFPPNQRRKSKDRRYWGFPES